ncbi:abnormal spindle-like microcephaly-associated protein homolog [Zeugodacus cucurbitae]|uniref:Abnormal spindle-like microcephaly-associated protein homolog n=1 Tax=Zeugodacus cucurbitae TaxID=28588 RepID=A0A0A1XIG1_ZEUCU|nr:abnormal spindle-like microcephaly-associated protein homolog [Zeugodacus cucurbitae]
MHIHPSSPSSDFDQPIQKEENAAIKIQAGFRGYRVRKQVQNQPRPNAPNYCEQQRQQHNSEPLHLNIGNRTTPQNINAATNSKGSIFEVESSTKEDQCATKIQAGVRGFLVRKKQKIAMDAATKIQASFRGFKARKEAHNMKQK